MKKLIIAVFGAANQGKTKTLRGLIKNLKKNKIKLLKEYKIHSRDDVAIFDYKNIKIGISTSGDNGNEIKHWVDDKLIKEYNCDIIVTASRTRGSSVKQLKKRKKTHNIVWIEKLYNPIRKINEKLDENYFKKLTALEIEYLTDYILNYAIR
ncbi:hypothetical protein [Otariodibacter oris]|uniref:Molybdopterin-guanine dinucleotide biosynthesis protein B n=1 Tax=Otariodibacter oris TaxID=1032623 RepID=A0A420XGA9_9PAST|nr:hypothetical protein [Otariodibacter oris]QGM79973.1 hypothetical protein A6A10_00415 [Otariodibacter oris]RKR71796.1 hypothetical protein DES31_1145 [Otariodibacter oris]